MKALTLGLFLLLTLSVVTVPTVFADEDADDKKIENTFPPGNIPTAFTKYWSDCSVESIDLVYYPYYGV